jgi:hypothetical protein
MEKKTRKTSDGTKTEEKEGEGGEEEVEKEMPRGRPL